MARNGSGTFNRLYDWTDDAAAGTKISSTRMDAEMDGMATALTDSIAKDGQTTPTANLPMGNFKHTGVAVASARTEYCRASQDQDSSLKYASAGGTADAITLTLAPAITAYAAGQRFHFIASGANTGAVTLNVNGVGATAVKKGGGNALVAGDIVSGQACDVIHDGTDFELLNPAAVTIEGAQTIDGVKTFSTRIDNAARVDVASVAGTTDIDAVTSNYIRITGTNTITAFTLGDGHWRDVVAGGAFSITAGASLILPGIASGSTITLAAGDTFRVIGEASSVVRVQNLSRARNALEITADVSTGSGTSIAVASSIPPGVRRITINFNGVAVTAANDILVQIGDSGGLETTSYASSSAVVVDAAATGVVNSTSGFIINNAGTGAFQGHMVLTLMNESSNRWIASHTMRSTTARVVSGGGIKALSATLDRITLVGSGGGAFTSGQVNIMYE